MKFSNKVILPSLKTVIFTLALVSILSCNLSPSALVGKQDDESGDPIIAPVSTVPNQALQSQPHYYLGKKIVLGTVQPAPISSPTPGVSPTTSLTDNESETQTLFAGSNPFDKLTIDGSNENDGSYTITLTPLENGDFPVIKELQFRSSEIYPNDEYKEDVFDESGIWLKSVYQIPYRCFVDAQSSPAKQVLKCSRVENIIRCAQSPLGINIKRLTLVNPTNGDQLIIAIKRIKTPMNKYTENSIYDEKSSMSDQFKFDPIYCKL